MHCKLCVDVHMCARARTHTHTMLRCIHAYMHTVKGKQTRGDKGEGGKGFGQEGGQGGREVNAVMDISKSASVAQKPKAASALAQNRQKPPVFDDEFFRNQLLQRSQARLGLRTGAHTYLSPTGAHTHMSEAGCGKTRHRKPADFADLCVCRQK